QHFRMSPAVGKPFAERERPRPDTNCRDSSAIFCLQPATAGSLGLDLAAAVDVTLMTPHPVKIPTGVYGPLRIQNCNYGALLLGRSSVSSMGLFVLPGVIDADFTGEIQIMAYTPFPPLTVKKGQRIAQLIPLPQLTSMIPPSCAQSRGDKGFGSSGIACLTMDLHTRPKKQVQLSYKDQTIVLWGLLDTGADTSIVAPEYWPKQWPCAPTTSTITGVGGFTLAQKTPPICLTLDNQQITTVLSIVSLPPTVQCLIGRDVLAQLGVVL
ncbi:POK9 protein, partial [Nesospiza acunhae]|nr:POK9 protein [Nesospiza acunhae]